MTKTTTNPWAELHRVWRELVAVLLREAKTDLDRIINWLAGK